MGPESRGPILRYIHRLAGRESATAESDGLLLQRFTGQRDEAAFAALVRRHGALVLGACRRVLGNYPDAEDAFQATFLVLLRRAGTLDGRGTLGSWLYAVAYRVALDAKRTRGRRRVKEQEVTTMNRPETRSDESSRNLRQAIDEEVSRLPERYRAPVVLCYLEGKTNEEAAQLLGWSKRSVTGRLARARDLLHKRLARRSFVFSVGWLAAQATQHPASAALVDTTLKTAVLFTAGQTVAAPVAALTQGVLKAMYLTKLKTVAALLAVTVALTGTGWLLQQALAAKPEALAAEPAQAAAPAEEKVNAANAKADKANPALTPAEFAKLFGTVKPMAGEFAWFYEIPWEVSIRKARERAIAEDKPLFLWVAQNTCPLGRT